MLVSTTQHIWNGKREDRIERKKVEVEREFHFLHDLSTRSGHVHQSKSLCFFVRAIMKEMRSDSDLRKVTLV